MFTALATRNLTVLVVDDQMSEQLAGEASGELGSLDLRFIRSWADAQRQCASAADLGGADVLLIDISFDKDRSLSAMDREHGFVPVGPMLALPYIGKRNVLSCVTYSAHVNNPHLHKNQYFLAAMGLILARSMDIPEGFSALHSKHLSGGDNLKHLDKEIGRLARVGITHSLDALVQGVSDYRDSMERALRAGRVSLLNKSSLLESLGRLKSVPTGKRSPASFNELYLALSGENWTDAIRLSSVFWDVINKSGSSVDTSTLEQVEAWLKDLKADSPVDWAYRVIAAQEEALQDDTPRPDVKVVIRSLMGADTPTKELTETLRYCVLFANAWAMEHPGAGGKPNRETVLERLGEGLDANTYLGWFGERFPGRKVIASDPPTGAFSVLRPLSSGETRHARCFLARSSSEVTCEDYRAIRGYRASEGWPELRTPPFKVVT